MSTCRLEVPIFEERYRENVVDEHRTLSVDDEEKEAALRFLHLPDSERTTIDALLRGRQPASASLREPASRVVRVFVSASFTDMIEERNALTAEAYPKLRAYCREKYGLDFQAVDLRWGVRSEDVDDHHLDHDFYREQLRECQATSAGPSFLAMIGHKSTAIPLPSRIGREQFVAMKDSMKTNSEDGEKSAAMLSAWYPLDTNALPNVHVLRSMRTAPGDNPKTMQRTKERLRTIMREATEDEALIYMLDTPAADQEWRDGFATVVEDDGPNLRAICCIRSIVNIGQYLDRDRVGRYIDLVPNTNLIDVPRYRRIWQLMNASMRVASPANIVRCKITWSDPRGVDRHTHAEHLQDVCNTLHNRIRDCIESGLQQRAPEAADSLYLDVRQHWLTAARHTQRFVGREAELRAIREYVQGSSSQPLVVHGASGHGKTALLAAAASAVPRWLAADDCTVNTTVVVRFCGTTPDSGSLRQLLHGVCQQVAYTGNAPRSRVPTDFKALKRHFVHLLQGGEFRGLVVLFIDAVDQLSSADAAHDLFWLPAQLTKNVKVIVSASSDEAPSGERVLRCLLRKITHARYHLRVGPLERGACGALIADGLASVNRTLTYPQSKLLRAIVMDVQSPLFTRVVLQEAYLKTSSMTADTISMSKCVSSAMEKLFERLEASHGAVLVIRVLSYFTAAKDGISDCELEDILSLDNEVLDEVYVDWEPAVRRVPPIVWLRIQSEISGYIVERIVHETRVFYWSNRQLENAARRRYLSDTARRICSHHVMADYYLGTWSGMRKKPFRYRKRLMDKLKKTSDRGAAVRYVSSQPLAYDALTGIQRLNTRKLSQLPHHLARAERTAELYDLVLFNHNWIRTKILGVSMHDVISDYALVTGDHEVALVAETLKMAQPAVAEDINTLGVEISGCLLPYYDSRSNIRSLIDQCDAAAQTFCPVVPNWQTNTAPGGPLECICSTNVEGGFDDVDTCLVQDSASGSVFLTIKRIGGQHMRVWDVNHSECRAGLILPKDTCVYPTPDGSHINVFVSKGCVQNFRMSSRELVGQIDYEPGQVGNVAVSNKYMAFTYLKMPSPVVLNMEASLRIERFNYHSHAIAISADERHLVCNNDHSIILHSFPLMEHKCVARLQQLPSKIIATRNNTKFYAMLRNKDIISITFHLNQKTGKVQHLVADLEIQDFKLSHAEEMILARASRRIYIKGVTVDSTDVQHCIERMPEGVYVDKLAVYSDAAFSMDDSLVLAARHTYLGVWDSHTAAPLRLLQWSVSPVVRLLTCDVVNKAITILADSSLQLWNFDNLDAGITYVDTMVRGSGHSLAIADDGRRLICCGSHQAEARVVDLETGACEVVLEHTCARSARLHRVLISPLGNYAVTRIANRQREGSSANDISYDDKLWHIDSGEILTAIANNCFVAFSQDDEKIVCFPRHLEGPCDETEISYDVLLLNMASQSSVLLDTSYGRITSEPFITGSGNYMVFIQDLAFALLDGVTEWERPQKLCMCIHSFGVKWHDTKQLSVHDMCADTGEGEHFVDVQLFCDDQVIAIYQNESASESDSIAKSAVIYDVRKGCTLRRIDQFLRPDTDVRSISVSNHKSVIIDNNYHMWDVVTGSYVRRLPLEGVVSAGSVRLILDGKYLAAISTNGRELLVFRTSDCYRKARVFVHGTATHLRVCGNENRTVVLCCSDGRVAMYTVVLDSADHIREITSMLPSRRRHRRPEMTSQTSALSDDVKYISKTINEHRQMTAERPTQQRAKPPGFKTVVRAAILASSYQRELSDNCATQ